jgi:hypothetical protein
MPAAGRQQIDYTDERMTSQTFWADGVTIVFSALSVNGAAATMIGKAVTYAASADDTVALTSDGDAIVGKLLKVEPDGACTVQIAGYTTLPAGASATVTRGRKQVGALGAASAKGYIRDAASATAAEQARRGPFAVANADLNNVVVDFGG